MDKEEFLRLVEEEGYAPGWDAIDAAFEKLYPGQEPDHFVTKLTERAVSGGDEYLDGYSVYTSPKGYKHIVTYGMTFLYGEEEAFGGEWNGWGYEMTIKLKEAETKNCMWAMQVLSNLARYTYESDKYFEPYHFAEGNGSPLHTGTDSRITALMAVYYTEAETQTSVCGKTEFIQFVGITEDELQLLIEDPSKARILADAMKADGNPDLVTDMKRTKSYIV